MSSAEPPGRRTLADRLNRLFDTLHPPERGPYTNREVANWLLEHSTGSEPTISVNYLAWLRSGARDNPTVSHLQAIARFFRVDPGYFLAEDDHAEAIYQDLELLGAIRDSDEIRGIALRAVELDPEVRAWLARTIQDMPQQGRRRRRPRPEESSPAEPAT